MKLTKCLMLLCLLPTFAWADDPPPMEDVESSQTVVLDLDAIMDEYAEDLEIRDVSIQSQWVLEALQGYDGFVIWEGTLESGDLIALYWDSQVGNVSAVVAGEEIPLDFYIDDYGRPSFEGDISGRVDVFTLLTGDVYIYLGIDAEDTLHSFGKIPPDGDASSPPQPLVQAAGLVRCLCKGSESRCQAADCRNQQPCNYTQHDGSVHSSLCKWLPCTIYAHPTSLDVPEDDIFLRIGRLGSVFIGNTQPPSYGDGMAPIN